MATAVDRLVDERTRQELEHVVIVPGDPFDEAHGRLVRRRVFASTEAANLETLSEWPSLHTVLAVETLQYRRRSQDRNRDPLLLGELS